MKYILVCASLLAMSQVQAEKHESLGEHVHGEANLSISSTSNKIIFDLDSPANSILGFEHKPVTKDEKAKWNEAKKLLLNGNVIVIPEEYGCKVLTKESKVSLNETEHHDDHDKEKHHDDHDKEKHHDDHEKEGEHSNLEAVITYSCKESTKPRKITIQFGKYFSHLKKLTVEVAPLKKLPFKVVVKSDKRVLEL